MWIFQADTIIEHFAKNQLILLRTLREEEAFGIALPRLKA